MYQNKAINKAIYGLIYGLIVVHLEVWYMGHGMWGMGHDTSTWYMVQVHGTWYMVQVHGTWYRYMELVRGKAKRVLGNAGGG